MTRQPTVYDVAERAGVSIATVSRFFSAPVSLSEKTRAAVAGAVDALGYVPSASARSLAAGRTETIALILPDFDEVHRSAALRPATGEVAVVRDSESDPLPLPDLYYNEVLRGAEIEAMRHGLALTVVLHSPSDPALDPSSLLGRVDGMVTVLKATRDEDLLKFTRRKPAVVVGGLPDPRFNHVGVNNEAGMEALTRHLIEEHGVTRPVLIAGPEESPDSRARTRGFARAVTAAGLAIDPAPIAHGDFQIGSGRTIAADLAARGVPGDAIVAANDQMAMGVLETFARQGIRVPEDVIVTGFDNITLARFSQPRLTTVEQPMLDVGRAAVDLLVRMIGRGTADREAVTLPVTVMLRESCGCGRVSES